VRAVIRRNDVTIEFSGRGQTWNELLRPYVGGPEAPAEPDPAPAPQAQAARQFPQQAAAQHATAAIGYRPPALVAPAPTAAAPAYQPAAAARPAAPSQPRTWYPPRPQQQQQPAGAPRRFEPPRPAPQAAPQHYSAEEDEPETVRVEPSSDPATLYARLQALPGRRSERDAVLAAMWFVTKGEREATGDEVERHFDALHVFPDVKVVPHLLKHVHRTKMLELGANPKAVRLSKKGVAYVRGRLVAN
jgi:hypothetical protein